MSLAAVAAAVTDARGMTKRGSGQTELTERLLASQGTFAGDVLRDHAGAPGTVATGARKSGGETTQASPSRRAGPVTCDRSTARRRADRGSPQICLPS